MGAAAQITSSLSVSAEPGYPGHYRITADNHPNSFAATNLPSGLSLDRTTGLVTGTPSLAGDWPTNLIAHGKSGDARATCVFHVYTDVPKPNTAVAQLEVDPALMVADPSRSRIYCGTVNSLVVIDTTSMSVLKTFPTGAILDLSISPDGRTLWVTQGTLSSLSSLDLVKLDHLTDLHFKEQVSEVREGLKNRLYGAAPNGDIVQFDPLNGAIEKSFTPSPGFRHMSSSSLAISPDGKTLYVADLFTVPGSQVPQTACARYDVSGQTPILLQRVPLAARGVGSFIVTPDGSSLYVGVNTFDLYGSATTHQTIALDAGDLSRMRGAFSYSGTAGGPIGISTDGRRAVQPVARLSENNHTMTALACVFDTGTFRLLGTLVAGSKTSAGLGQIFIQGTVFDPSGSFVFASTDLYPGLRAYSVPSPNIVPVSDPKRLLNISTRMVTGNQDNVLIGGFIVEGTTSKRVILRAIGSSLPLSTALADPVLELHGSDGSLIAENDDWYLDALDILPTHLAPQGDNESAIIATLPPGSYTAIVRGFKDSTGVSLVEAYDLEPAASSELANISSRGRVETGDNVMIGGFVIGGDVSTTVAIRALGPSLAQAGVSDPLEDPVLELHDGNGNLQAENDNWRNGHYQELVEHHLAPSNEYESALLVSLGPGNYTAVVRGKDSATGIALLEVYNLP